MSIKLSKTKSIVYHPDIIEGIELDHLNSVQKRQDIETTIVYFEANLEVDIFNTPEFNNESIRKAMITKCKLESEVYKRLVDDLKAAKHEELKIRFTLERYKREYSILELEKKEAIAELTKGKL